MSQLEANLRGVRDRIDRATHEVAREPGSVQLLAVTKSVSASLTAELHELGVRDLAENRAPAFEEKVGWFTERGLDPRWHFIGHLQRNKARRIVRLASVIHSVDSLRLAETLERTAGDEGRRIEVYLQLNAAREDQKHGIDPGPPGIAPQEALARGELSETLAFLAEAQHLAPQGLMAMGPLVSDQAPRAVFEEVAGLARTLAAEPERRRMFPEGRPRLSMGMSGDLEAAVAAGSDLVRVGTALFEGIPSPQLPT